MRNFLLPFLLLPTLILAQNSSGIIEYEEVMQIKIDLPEDVKAMAIEIPSEEKTSKTLLFSPEATLFKNKANDEGPQTIEADGGDFKFKMVRSMPDNQVYQNLKAGTRTEMKEFFGKKFLIEEAQKKYTWKITSEQKPILDMLCMKAVYKDSTRSIEAWFTPQIPISSGPDNLGGLPGMILEVSIDDGQRVTTATKVEYRKLQKDEIQAPSKGKSVTREEYEEIVSTKMKEMEMEMGGHGGGVRVIRRN